MRVVTSSKPQTTVQEVKKFVSLYPHSEFLGVAFEMQMLAYKRMNNFEGVFKAGHRALQLEPKNVATLLALASAIPNAVSRQANRSALLDEAEQYADLVLEILPGMKIPREIAMKRWEVMRGEMESQAHEALGHVALKKGNLQKAIAEFEIAVSTNPTPIGRQFFRLGVAYSMAGEMLLARKALTRAAGLGPDEIRKLATEELKGLSDRKVRQAGAH